MQYVLVKQKLACFHYYSLFCAGVNLSAKRGESELNTMNISQFVSTEKL